MIASRVVLHLAAIVLPVLAVLVALQMLQSPARDFWLVGAGAVIAAQVAALLAWPFLARSTVSPWLAPLGIGLVMALFTHALFGPVCAFLTMYQNGNAAVGELLYIAMLASIGSTVIVGWASAPLIMAVCVLVNRLRRKELHRAAV